MDWNLSERNVVLWRTVSTIWGELMHKLYPLHASLKTGMKWNWAEKCSKFFTQIKNCLSEAPILVHYDPKLPVRLAGDALNYGIGTVLSHVDCNGQEHPIAFISRTLSKSKKNYFQVDKEALSLIHGIRTFRNYLYLLYLVLRMEFLGRLQRWALYLSSCDYKIEFRPWECRWSL